MKRSKALYIELAKQVETSEDGVPCQNAPDAFFIDEMDPNRRYKLNLARSLCQECPLSMLCLEYAVEARETHGIWAGTLPEERMAMRRERRLSA